MAVNLFFASCDSSELSAFNYAHLLDLVDLVLCITDFSNFEPGNFASLIPAKIRAVLRISYILGIYSWNY